MEGIKGERSEQQSNRAENQHRNGIDLGHFEVEKVRFFHEKCFVSIFRIVLPMRAGSTIPEKSWKKYSESENWSHNNVRNIKILPKWGRIHEDGIKIMSDTSLKSPTEATCSKNTHNCDVF